MDNPFRPLRELLDEYDRALINHEYQHDQWIAEVRNQNLGHALPDDPTGDGLCRVDGYLMLDPRR